MRDQRIRLVGIDAPEGRQFCQISRQDYRCGQQAALALSDFIGRATVSCEDRDRDRYGRIVSVCPVRGEDLNAWMVRKGWALVYRHYRRNYIAAEGDVRSNNA